MSQLTGVQRLAARMALVIVAALFGVLSFAAPASAMIVPPGSIDGANEGQTEHATNAVGGMFVAGATDAVNWALSFLDIGATPVVHNDGCSGGTGSCWFKGQYDMMKAMAIWVLLPLVFIATIHAVAKGSLNMIMKIYLIFVPVAVLGSTAAVQIVQLLLNVTDDFSRAFLGSVSQNAEAFFAQMLISLGGFGFWLSILFGLALLFVSIMVYLVLVLREASIYIATSFLPIGFAMLVWPSTARFFRKMAEFLLAMIFSKLVMVAGISLAMASMTGAVTGDTSVALGSGANVGAAADDTSTAEDFALVIEAIAMFGIVAFAPSMCMRLIGNLAVGEAAGAIGAALDRPSAVPQTIFAARVWDAGKISRDSSAYKKMIKANTDWAGRTSAAGYALEQMGVYRNGDGNYIISQEELDRSGVDARFHDQIRNLSMTENANDQALAFAALAAGDTLTGIDRSSVGGYITRNTSDGAGGTMQETVAVLDVVDHNGQMIQRHDPAIVHRITNEAARNGSKSVQIFHGHDQNAPQNAKQIQRLNGAANQAGAAVGVRTTIAMGGVQQLQRGVRAPADQKITTKAQLKKR